jgi:Predicted permeases
MENVNSEFILSLSIIVLGYLAKRLNIIKEKDGEGMARLVFNITLPSLIINTFNTMKLDFSLIYLTIGSFLFGILMSLIGVFVFKKEARTIRGTLTMLTPGFNIGLFAYPLVESIWGANGLKYFGMFDMGNSLIMFGVCYIIANYFAPNEENIDFKTIAKKLFTSIPLMTYIITLIINLSGLHYPSGIIDISKIISKANAPLSLLLLGIYLNFSIDKGYWKNIIKILSLRYTIGLAIGAALFLLLPFDSLFRYTLLIGFILPIGSAVIPYAVQFNYDEKLVGTLCNITIIISFIMIWAIISLSSFAK